MQDPVCKVEDKKQERMRFDWEDMVKFWTMPQTDLGHLRWRQYKHVARNQTCLQHQYSIVLLGMLLTRRLRMWLVFDRDLLLTALEVHDLGEGVLKRDVLLSDKTDNHDLDEYLAFSRAYLSLVGEEDALYLKKAFLLQFALRNPECFPQDARLIMAELAERKSVEALLFDAIEHLDYYFYAMEQYVKLGVREPLEEVLKKSWDKMETLAKQIEGFGAIVWTEKVKNQFKAFLEAK